MQKASEGSFLIDAIIEANELRIQEPVDDSLLSKRSSINTRYNSEKNPCSLRYHT